MFHKGAAGNPDVIENRFPLYGSCVRPDSHVATLLGMTVVIERFLYPPGIPFLFGLREAIRT
jgi:hypothetical protein